MTLDECLRIARANGGGGIGGVLAFHEEELVAAFRQVEAEALQSAVTHLLEKAAQNHERCNYTAESAYRDAAYAVNALARKEESNAN